MHTHTVIKYTIVDADLLSNEGRWIQERVVSTFFKVFPGDVVSHDRDKFFVRISRVVDDNAIRALKEFGIEVDVLEYIDFFKEELIKETILKLKECNGNPQLATFFDPLMSFLESVALVNGELK